MTRAKEELNITFPLRYHVNRFGSDDRHVYAQMSRFLEPVIEHFDKVGDRHDDGIDLRHEPASDEPVRVADGVDTLLASLWG